MVQVGSGSIGGAREEIRLRVAEAGLDFDKAKDLAKRKAREVCSEAMLLSWNNAETGEYYPFIVRSINNMQPGNHHSGVEKLT